LPAHAWLFGEDQGRYLLAVAKENVAAIVASATAAGVPVVEIGVTGGDALTLPGEAPILLSTLIETHERFFPALMAGTL